MFVLPYLALQGQYHPFLVICSAPTENATYVSNAGTPCQLSQLPVDVRPLGLECCAPARLYRMSDPRK